jgi:hypothetical protein
MQQNSQQQRDGQGGGNGGGGHGLPRVHLRVQTPRGLWSMTEPAEAPRRPEYAISTAVAEVIADARTVFKFVEQDSLYTLFLNGAPMAPERPLASYQVVSDALLVLSVQGGNASER